MSFKCLRVTQTPEYAAHLTHMELGDLSEGDVVIRSHYSGLNYKDALAITGKGKILKHSPLNPGIDVSGVVEQSRDPRFKEGDPVLVNGCGLGETHDGGFSERVRVPADWIVPLPKGLSSKEAMVLGTAGFTAALSLWRMEQNGQAPQQGPVVVTGASGGVGSFAIQVLSQAGYEVIAVSGKKENHKHLIHLGAKEAVTAEELNLGERPLESARFGGAIDNVGGDLLSGLTRHINLWGNIACVGLAASAKLETTVMPMILRGVSLLGISSANCPQALRKAIWEKLSKEWKPSHLQDVIYKEIGLEELPLAADSLLNRQVQGRYLLKL